ncbi:DNA cytosine methyltransferase [Mycobacterium sp. smrl_JER01]|uniref:DNA cytosine methyltransferase n=1 Tax=Mycobacterium sp. smrl_JER01 TaxID=3402633 RepID=UPI003AC281F6
MSTKRKSRARSSVPASATAEHRPAVRPRRFKHDDLVAVDLFSGFGGLTQGIKQAGFTTIMAANHNRYKIEVHEANHPEAEHWIADLVNREASDYHSARELPAADLLAAGISCVNHTIANSKKAYQQGLSLFDLDDPEFEERVTRSERDRATANCVLAYAATHHPRLILVECTTELQSWGPQVPGKKYGDGSTYRWWLKQFDLLGYKYRVLYLNSMFFGVPQSRDRLYVALWDRRIPTPDLDHRPRSWCGGCDRVIEAVWTWKTGVPPTGSVRYGKQYEYRCPSCRGVVVPPFAPSLAALDLRDLGTKIGDRKKPLAAATMARAERCRQRFAEFPAVLMPAKALRGSEKHPWQPMATQTSQQETGVLSTGAIMAAAGNTFERAGSDCRSRDLSEALWAQTSTNATGIVTPPVAVTGQVMAAHRHNGDGKHFTRPMDTVTSTPEKAVLVGVLPYRKGTAARGADEVLPTQAGGESVGLLSTGVVPFRRNTVPTVHAESMPTVTTEQIPGLLTAAGMIKNNGSIDEAGYRSHPVSSPLGSVVSSPTQSLLFSGWSEQNGVTAAQFPQSRPLFDSRGAESDAGMLGAQWQDMLADLALEDCYFRMMKAHEIGRGCGFDVTFAEHIGSFTVWGSARDQTDGYGNAVSPPVGQWLGLRLRAALHSESAA